MATLLALLGLAGRVQGIGEAPDPLQLGSKTIPFVQPGCNVMYRPGSWCLPVPSPTVKGCCTPGHSCQRDRGSVTGHTCRPVPAQLLSYSYEQQRGQCSSQVEVGGQCGGAGFDCTKHNTCDQFGPWVGFCCPNGYSCQPYSRMYRKWTCQVDVQDQPPVDASKELLQYPPRAMPAGACTCRHGWGKDPVPMDCPSPWSSIGGTSQVAPALKLAKGTLVRESDGRPAVLRGVNWFGWSVGSFNFDGLWAFCDDNTTSSTPPCRQDGDIPPHEFPSASIGAEAQKRLNVSYWGKRRMTNDFAAVVWRIKLLGFNAIRVQFKFSDLNLDIPESSNKDPEFFPCLHDSDEYVAIEKTLDPQLIVGLGDKFTLPNLRPYMPSYKGMAHPPPKTGNPRCDEPPWEAPFLPEYKGGRGDKLRLTMCNWYLPQGRGVPALYRFVWQLQYLVSQGFYLLLDFSSTREVEPNMQSASLLAQNWGRLWRILADIPAYKEFMAGRIFPDLINEPSRWGCQWDSACTTQNGTACAPLLQSLGLAASAIWAVDPGVPIFLNAGGQDHLPKYDACGNAYPGMHWGDGFITRKDALNRYNLSDPSALFTTALTSWVGPFARVEKGDSQMPRLVLAPHIYPASVTGSKEDLIASLPKITGRWDLSWGWKAQGIDVTSDGARIPQLPVVIGESGARDSGDNSAVNADTTVFTPADRTWLDIVATYLRTLSEKTGHQPSYFWWAWNANSGDTKGLVGPNTTWREVQWTKVRLLIRNYGLRPWYCGWWPDFCDTVEW